MTSIIPLVDSPETYYRLVAELGEKPLTIQEFAENVRELHMGVASSDNREVSGGRVYKASQANLLAMIRLAYPTVAEQEVYEVWVDCSESIAYCANWVRNWGSAAIQASLDA